MLRRTFTTRAKAHHPLFGTTGWLFLFIFACYFATYRGYPDSTDSAVMFSSAESLVKYGTLDVVSSYHERPNTRLDEAQNPFLNAAHEPLQSILASPLYALAYYSPLKIGLMHSVWLFNLGVSAGVVVLFYTLGRTLDASTSASLAGALLLGLGSSLWVYSQTFFREPLAAFWALCAYGLAWRLHRIPHWREGLALLAVLVALFLTKLAVLTLLPTLFILLYPTPAQRAFLRRHPQWLGVGLALSLMAGGLALFLAYRIAPENDRLTLGGYSGRALDTNLSYFWTVFSAYWLSPGRSVWANAPFLLVGIYGAWLWWREGQWRIALAPLVFLATLTLAYAFSGWDWHGGRGWGTRYLLPTLPILASYVLPVLEKWRGWQFGLKVGFSILVAFSILIQVGGVLTPLGTFYGRIQTLFGEQALSAYYDEGTWLVRYTQWYSALQALDFNNPDYAWRYANPQGAGLGLSLLLGGLALYGVWGRRPRLAASLALIALALGLPWSLSTLRHDPRYQGERSDLNQALAYLETRVSHQDIFYLSNPSYQYFFMNFYQGAGRLVVLPYAPGERYSPEQSPQSEIDADGEGTINANERISTATRTVFDHARFYQRAWLLSNLSPFHTWAHLPEEYWLSFTYYRFSAQEFSPTVRLTGYFTGQMAYPMAFRRLVQAPPTGYRFEEGPVLAAVDLGEKERYAAGDFLPVALLWQVPNPIPQDYSVSVQVLDENGRLVAQNDGLPTKEFNRMSQWYALQLQKNFTIYFMDARALFLPLDLPVGRYQVQVALYTWQDGRRLPVFLNDKLVGDVAQIATFQVSAP
jgi:hypothetical protein